MISEAKKSHNTPSAFLEAPDSWCCNFVELRSVDLRRRSAHIWSQEKMDVPA